MSGSPASIRRTASPIIGWSSISKTVTLCSVRIGFGAHSRGSGRCRRRSQGRIDRSPADRWPQSSLVGPPVHRRPLPAAWTCSRTSRVIPSAIWSRCRTSSAAPSSTAALGMPQTTLDDLVLGDGSPAQAAEGQQPLGAVVEHAGQQHGDARPGPVPGHAVEEHVDRGPVAGRPGLGRVAEAAVLAQDEVVVGDGEQDLAGGGPVPFLDQRDRPPRLLGRASGPARARTPHPRAGR